jgi:hypothetical protein
MENIIEFNNIDLSILVEKAMHYYDMKIQQYEKYKDVINIVINREESTIQFPSNVDIKTYKYEVLGIFDNMTSIWMWAWMIPEFLYNETLIVKKLLNYGLKINPSILTKLSPDKLYLKTQLVNSRFLLQDEFQLELHLAISCYLAKDNFKFIYSKKKYLSSDKMKYITVYYLVI